MTEIRCRYGNGGEKEPYHYTESGLDEVYLVSGYEVHDTPYGEGVSVKDVDGLHRAIGHWIVREKKTLSGKEIRFLRKDLGLTQAGLADRLGTTSQTLARWESEKFEITGPADILLRVIYMAETLGKTDPELGLKLRAIENSVHEVMFTPQGGKWHPLGKAA